MFEYLRRCVFTCLQETGSLFHMLADAFDFGVMRLLCPVFVCAFVRLCLCWCLWFVLAFVIVSLRACAVAFLCVWMFV